MTYTCKYRNITYTYNNDSMVSRVGASKKKKMNKKILSCPAQGSPGEKPDSLIIFIAEQEKTQNCSTLPCMYLVSVCTKPDHKLVLTCPMTPSSSYQLRTHFILIFKGGWVHPTHLQRILD